MVWVEHVDSSSNNRCEMANVTRGVTLNFRSVRIIGADAIQIEVFRVASEHMVWIACHVTNCTFCGCVVDVASRLRVRFGFCVVDDIEIVHLDFPIDFLVVASHGRRLFLLSV